MKDFNLWEKVKLPPELLERLNAMIRRIRMLQLARGVLATVGVALASILVVMGVDAALVIYSDGVRLCLSLAALAITLLTAYIALWRPLTDKITPVRMARIVETRHPELQERISSALELLGAGGGAAAEGSGQLLEILASDAASDITGVSAKSEFRGTTLRPVIISTSIILTVFAVVFVVWPRQSALLFARAVAPGAPLGNLASRGFSVTPGDIVIVEGESILFTLTAPGESGSRAELCIERKNEPLSVERLQRRFGPNDSDAVFELEMPAVRDSFRYRMRLGNALTRYYSVAAVPPPAHGPFDMILTYPEYTGLGTTQFTSAAEVRLVAPVGTRAGVRTTLNRKMDAVLHVGGRTISPVEKLPTDEVTFDWLFEKAKGTSRWGLALRDSRGFTNAPSWALYEPVPDYAPHVQLTYPTGNAYTLPTFGLLKLVYALTDDHGLSQTRLAILPDNDKNPWYVDLGAEATEDGSWNVTHNLSLSDFQLNGARKLRIWLEVSDNLPTHLDGPNLSKSRVVAVDLDNGQKRSLADQVRIPEREALTNLLESAARRLEEAARKIANVTNQTDAAVINKAVQEAATVAEEASKEVDKAADTAEKGLFAGVSEDVRDVAETAVEEAREATEEAAEAVQQQQEDEAQRLAREAMEALNAAAQETRELVPEILEKDKVLEEASAIEAAAAEEAREAQKAMERQLTDAEMTAWQAKQEELAEKIDAYDLRNDILDKEEQPVASGEMDSGKWKVESGDGRTEFDQTGEQASNPTTQQSNEQTDKPINEQTTQPSDDGTNKRPNDATEQRSNGTTVQRFNEAASAARAAARAAEAAKAVDVNEDKLKLARQAEAAAKEGKRAATEAQRATDAIKSLERDREALEQIRDTAEAAAKEAGELADDALQVRLEAVRNMAEAIPPDVAKAMDLAKRSESLAALADKALKAAEDGHPISPESLAAQAAALRKEAEELAKAAKDNPFLKRSAEMAADVARRAEEAVAGLRAAMREGADEETARKALEKAADATEAAAKASEHAVENAERAANDIRENAVAAAIEASEIASEAEQLHEELQKAIAASRAALEQGKEETGNGEKGTDNRQTVKPSNRQTEEERINERAAALAARAAEAARTAEAAESAARQKQSGMAADMAQKAKQAAAAAQKSAEAAAQAANSELAGQKQQADARQADAKRLAEEAARNAEASQANADILAVPAAEHARRAAEAAKLAADLASGEVESGKGKVESGDGRAELDQSKNQEAGNGEQPNDATMQRPNDATNERLNGQTVKRLNEAASAAAEAAIKAAREAAAAAEKAANERRENLPVEAARAARTAADQAEAALREQANDATMQRPNDATAQQTNEQTSKRINDALAAAQDAAKAASKAARRAATRPDEHVAELANEGRLASKALDNVADKVADAARLAQESAAEKKEANGDAEKTAAAEAKAEEARRLFEDAKREAHSIGQGLSQLSAETRPVIANAERVAREEEAALKRIGEESETPLDLLEKLPSQIALQGARDMQRLFDEDRRTAGELENIGNWGMHNPAEAIRQSQALASRADQAAERAESIAATPGIRPAPQRGTDREEGTGKREQGIENGEQDNNGSTVQRSNGPTTEERINEQTIQPSNYPTPEAKALADQVASAQQQIDEARFALEGARNQGSGTSSPDGRTGFDQSGEQGTGNREQANDATTQRSNESTEQPSNRQTVKPSNEAAEAATAAQAAESAAQAATAAQSAAAAAERTAARANSSLTKRQDRADAAMAASEKASQSAAASAAKLAEAAGKLVAEEALQAASGQQNNSSTVQRSNGSTNNEITGKTMFDLVSHISAAAGKATAARAALERGTGEVESEKWKVENEDGRTAFDQPTDTTDNGQTVKPSNRQTAVASAAATAAEAIAEADEALRQAKLLQAPTEEQMAAAKEAYKAALAMRKMALEHAEKAGLDPETMKTQKTDGGRRRERDPNRKKKPAPTMKDGNGGGRHDDSEEEEYEDGLSLEMPEWLRKLGFPRSEWLKYKGSLESGLPDGALEKVAPEYRDLVRRYFELLSKEK